MLEKRGRLAPGWHADITLFDPRTVADKATFDSPRSFPAGIPYVMVNGELVVEQGDHTGAAPGQVLYHQSGGRG
jgi:N-acyl-D-amino-acid deacylase